MDIGKLKNNYTFYKQYEGEGEISFEIESNPAFNIHIWEGLFDDIFDKPIMSDDGWKGFTRDYQEEKGAFDLGECIINLEEYIEDFKQYKDFEGDFEESKQAYDLILSFLEYAKDNGENVRMKYF